MRARMLTSLNDEFSEGAIVEYDGKKTVTTLDGKWYIDVWEDEFELVTPLETIADIVEQEGFQVHGIDIKAQEVDLGSGVFIQVLEAGVTGITIDGKVMVRQRSVGELIKDLIGVMTGDTQSDDF